MIGFLLAIYSSAAFIIRIFLPNMIRRFTAEKVMAYSYLIGATGFLLMPFFKSTVILSLVSFVFGLGTGCGVPVTMMITFRTSAQGRSGEAMGIRVTANNVARVLGQVLFGAIGSSFGVFAVCRVNALMMASGWVVSHPGASGTRHETS